MRQPSPTGSVTTSSPGDYTRQAGKVTPIMAAVLAVTGVFVLFSGFAIAVVTVATVTGAGGVPPTTSSTPSAPVTTIDTAPTTTTTLPAPVDTLPDSAVMGMVRSSEARVAVQAMDDFVDDYRPSCNDLIEATDAAVTGLSQGTGFTYDEAIEIFVVMMLYWSEDGPYMQALERCGGGST